MPESAVFRGASQPARSDVVELERLLKHQRDHWPSSTVVAGLYESVGAGDRYRCASIVSMPDGRLLENDKCRGLPGIEVVPFNSIPFSAQFFNRASPVDSELVVDQRRRQPIRLPDGTRLAVAVCFDASCPNGDRAWGFSGAHVDVLIVVARLEVLGPARAWEAKISRRVRRLHSAILGAPLVYVHDGVAIRSCGRCADRRSTRVQRVKRERPKRILSVANHRVHLTSRCKPRSRRCESFPQEGDGA